MVDREPTVLPGVYLAPRVLDWTFAFTPVLHKEKKKWDAPTQEPPESHSFCFPQAGVRWQGLQFAGHHNVPVFFKLLEQEEVEASITSPFAN